MPRVTVRWPDLELSFHYASAEGIGVNRAWLSLVTGEFHWYSELGDNLEELPEDIDDASRYVQLPHKNELDLGRRLAFRFVREQAPELMDDVEDTFRRRGAYGRSKDLLDDNDLMEQWYAYEEQATRTVLRTWCDENDVGLEECGSVAAPECAWRDRPGARITASQRSPRRRSGIMRR